MKKQKIYISGKITGLKESDALELFNKAEEHLKELGYDVVNPMTIEHNHSKSWADYMRADLIAMLKCDAVYMLDNWRDSKGATVERNLAFSLDFDIIYQ